MSHHLLTHSRPIDIHCHQRRDDEALQILSFDTSDLALAKQSDAEASPNPISVGIHPWFIAKQDIDAAFELLENVCRQANVLAIGECGLDKCVKTPLETQTAVFCRQIELAEQFHKPLIIHCVRAFNELLALRKALKPSQAWIIHGFTGKPALAAQLLKHGCYLSLGKALLKPKHPVTVTLSKVPPGRLFLETDAAEEVSIGAIYSQAAKILGLDLPTLQRQIVANFERVFAHD
jgi:TatD DNase family protein